MKARFAIAALALCASLFVSCSKQEDLHPISTVLITVKQSDWQYSNADNNNYFYATVQMPEITESVFDTGLIKTYRVYDYNSSNPTQMELPYVRHNEYSYQDGEDTYWGFYTETVDYEITIGKITIFYTASDFDYELDETYVPDAMQFRCVVMN